MVEQSAVCFCMVRQGRRPTVMMPMEQSWFLDAKKRDTKRVGLNNKANTNAAAVFYLLHVACLELYNYSSPPVLGRFISIALTHSLTHTLSLTLSHTFSHTHTLFISPSRFLVASGRGLALSLFCASKVSTKRPGCSDDASHGEDLPSSSDG